MPTNSRVFLLLVDCSIQVEDMILALGKDWKLFLRGEDIQYLRRVRKVTKDEERKRKDSKRVMSWWIQSRSRNRKDSKMRNQGEGWITVRWLWEEEGIKWPWLLSSPLPFRLLGLGRCLRHGNCRVNSAWFFTWAPFQRLRQRQVSLARSSWYSYVGEHELTASRTSGKRVYWSKLT